MVKRKRPDKARAVEPQSEAAFLLYSCWEMGFLTKTEVLGSSQRLSALFHPLPSECLTEPDQSAEKIFSQQGLLSLFIFRPRTLIYTNVISQAVLQKVAVDDFAVCTLF